MRWKTEVVSTDEGQFYVQLVYPGQTFLIGDLFDTYEEAHTYEKLFRQVLWRIRTRQ